MSWRERCRWSRTIESVIGVHSVDIVSSPALVSGLIMESYHGPSEQLSDKEIEELAEQYLDRDWGSPEDRDKIENYFNLMGV